MTGLPTLPTGSGLQRAGLRSSTSGSIRYRVPFALDYINDDKEFNRAIDHTLAKYKDEDLVKGLSSDDIRTALRLYMEKRFEDDQRNQSQYITPTG